MSKLNTAWTVVTICISLCIKVHPCANDYYYFFIVENIYDITVSEERLIVHSIYLKSTVLFREGTSALTLREFSNGTIFTPYLYPSRFIEIQI